MPMTPDLENWQPTAGQAKNVEDTKMLDTTARETSDTVSADNTNTEYVAKNPSFGKLGAN